MKPELAPENAFPKGFACVVAGGLGTPGCAPRLSYISAIQVVFPNTSVSNSTYAKSFLSLIDWRTGVIAVLWVRFQTLIA